MVSPGHGLLWKDVLIPAGELVNGGSVVHDIVLAEDLPAESYLDVGSRADFAGGATTTLYPLFAAAAHEAACRPFALVGPKVEAARKTLAENAVVGGLAAGRVSRPRIERRRAR